MAVMREGLKNNTSVYRINDKKVSREEMKNILMERGIDLEHNRFLILQGEVEQIAQMTPKAERPEEEGLLEYLEDIIGSNRFIQDIERTAAEHDVLCGTYQEKANRCKVARMEVEELEGPRKEAEDFLRVERQLTRLKLLKNAREKFDELTKFNRISEELEAAEREKEAKDAADKEIKDSLQGLKEKLDGFSDVHKVVYDEYSKLESKFQTVSVKDEQFRNEILHDTKLKGEKTATIQSLSKQLPEEEERARVKVSEASELEGKIPEAQQAVQKADDAVDAYRDSLQVELRKIGNHLSKAEKELAPLQQELDEATQCLTKYQGAADLLQQRKIHLESQMEQLQQNANKCNDLRSEKKKLLQQLQESRQRRETERGEVDKKLQGLQQQLDCLENEANGLRQQIKKMRRQEEENHRSTRTQKFVMDLVKAGKLQGVHDVLGELGSIDKKYETAFMSAGGGFTDYFVVDLPAQAAALFGALREGSQGRANALALSVLQSDLQGRLSHNDRRGSPVSGVPRLIDLVVCPNPSFRVAFYKAVGETLVAPDNESAKVIGYGKGLRVVSLEGMLIEADGRMVGGGSAHRTRGIRTEVVDLDALRRLEQNLKKLDEKIGLMSEQKSDLARQRSRCLEFLGDLETREALAAQHANAAEEQLRDLKSQWQQLGAPTLSEAEAKELEDLNANIEAAAQRKARILQAVSSKEEEKSKIAQELQEVGGEPMKAKKHEAILAHRHLNKIRDSVDRLRKAGAQAAADAETFRKNIGKLKLEIQEHEVEIPPGHV
eukprot:GHVT01096927.1.p1 GENE.GHVT01096927.1~~GHVT01096927.1.p1  ORF type:complete len:789 (+),score=250.90 GHVT01096927.1:32-2368(+)